MAQLCFFCHEVYGKKPAENAGNRNILAIPEGCFCFMRGEDVARRVFAL